MSVGLMRLSLVATLAMGIAAAAPLAVGAPAEKQDARKHYDQATAAFGLGRYADAAAEYEAAFRLRPEPALLYNCAQSYRLAGSTQRAIELYRNYVRLYGNAPNADDARKHVADLELEVAAARSLPTPPPAAVLPGPSPGSTALTAPFQASQPVPPGAAPRVLAPSPPAITAPLASTQPRPLPAGSSAPPSTPSPGTAIIPPSPPAEVHVDVPAPASGASSTAEPESRSLLSRPWFWGVVGAAVVGGTVAVILASSGEKDPRASLGVIPAN